MLHRYINSFLDYCQPAGFSPRSIQALTARLTEFQAWLKFKKSLSVKKIAYRYLIDFVSDYKASSIQV